MLTNNFRNMMAMVLQRSSMDKGLLPCVAYNGTQYYISPSAFPGINSPTQSLTLTASSAGICVGTGDTAAAATDHQLEAPITAGLQASIVQTLDTDAGGNPVLMFDITVTNNNAEAVTIREIGYRQNIRGAATVGATGSNRVCLWDRTVLDTPVAIAARAIGVIRYTLKTIIE